MAALLLLSILLQFCLGHSNGYAIEPKIVNGIESHPEEFPFFVNIIHPRMVCGAALISDRWIVTAGHCLRKRLNFHVDIGVGAKGRFQRSIRIDTDHQHLYPGHNETMKLFDIGLIELPEPIELSPSIQPVPFPRTCDQVAQYELVYAAGNGRTNYKKPATDRTLRYGVSEVMPNDECAAKIKDHEDPNAIIYAYSIDGRDVGSGDSGGPVLRAKDQTLIGVVSSVIMSRSDPGLVYFQVFTRFSHFYDWIALKTGLELPKCGNQAPVYQ